MLHALRKYDNTAVQYLLSDLTTTVLPNNIAEEKKERETDVELKIELMHEVRTLLKLSDQDSSPAAVSEIQKFLANEISRVVLSNVDADEIKARLGQNGNLDLNLYKIRFSDAFKTYEKFSIRRSVIINSMRNPDQYQHLHAEHFKLDAEKSISIYAKNIFPKKVENAHTLLIQSQRKGFTQIVSDAWHVYHAEVDVSDARLPEDILRAFVDVFGADIIVGQKRGKFFWNEKIPISAESGAKILGIPEPREFEVGIAEAQIGEIENGFVQVLHAYGINFDKYKENLRKHGIIVR